MDRVYVMRMSPAMKARHKMKHHDAVQNNILQYYIDQTSCDTKTTESTDTMATSPELSPPALVHAHPFLGEEDSEASCGFSRDHIPETGTIKRAKPKPKPKDDKGTTAIDGHTSGAASSAPSSRTSTLRAELGSKSPHKVSPRSPKSPSWRKKESDVPTVKAETARVMEMFLKRRSMSLNDAVLQDEFFLQERKRKDKARNAPRNKTISICSTISSESTEYPRTSGDFDDQQVQITVRRTRPTTRKGAAPIAGVEEVGGGDGEGDGDYDEETLKRRDSKAKEMEDDEESTLKRTVKGSFIKALRHPVDQDRESRDSSRSRRTREQSSADDEASSPEQERGREISRSAPSTLRMQVGPPTRADIEKLKKYGSAGNGVAHHAYPLPPHQKIVVRRESSKKRDQPKRRKSLLDKARERFGSPSTQRRPAQDDSKDEDSRSDRSEVHKEMKKTGFAARLRRTFGRRDSKKGSRDSDYMAESDTSASVSVNALQLPKDHHSKQKRWPSFQFKRKPRKSVSTPTDDSLAGATPSDTASMTDWPSFSDRDHTLSLTEPERQKLLTEIHQGVHLRTSISTGSDTQLSSSVQTVEKKTVVKTFSSGAVPKAPDQMSGSRTSSQESNLSSISSESGRHQRPKSLNLRQRRAERARRAGLNEMLHIDRTTPGHMRRDTHTGEPLMPPPATSDDVLTNGAAPDNVSEGTSELWETSGGQDLFARALAETDDSSRSFHDLSQEEQEDFFKRIAERLAQIGDQMLKDYRANEAARGGANAFPEVDKEESSGSSVAWTTSSGASASASVPDETAETYQAIGERIQQDVDSITLRSRSHLPFPQQSIMDVISNRTYNMFYETMQSLLGQNTSLEELALVFKFTKLAIKVAHKLGQRASTIKENSIRYIGDRFAEWLDSQGGWGSVVYSSDSESEESKESEID